MADFNVINHPAGIGQTADTFGFKLGVIQIAVFQGGGNVLQLLIEAGRFCALCFAQILVAAGKCQAV